MASGRKVIYVIEGDLATVRFPIDSLWGALINANIRRNSFVFRTLDLAETAQLVQILVAKMEKYPGAPSGLAPPLSSKRKRDADIDTVWTRQLMCVPSVAKKVAEALLQHFGSLPKLQQALVDVKSFPKVRVSDRSCVGKQRVLRLQACLVDPD